MGRPYWRYSVTLKKPSRGKSPERCAGLACSSRNSRFNAYARTPTVKSPTVSMNVRRYAQAAAEDAQFADSPLRPVWRRHISNPDHRGNPQLSVMLQIQLFTHLNSTPAVGPGPSDGSRGTAVPAPPVATAIPLPSDDPDALRRECVFAMTPLLIPILCKVTITVPGT